MKFKFPERKEKLVFGDLSMPFYGSLSFDESLEWDEAVAYLSSEDAKTGTFYGKIITIFAKRIGKESELKDFDFNKVPIKVLEDLFALCRKEVDRWKEPEPIIEAELAEKKLLNGTGYIIDSTNTTEISELEIDLIQPQST
jgi:hypothetical protein